jgi:hypothetical protein
LVLNGMPRRYLSNAVISRFKSKFGHCNVPYTHTANPSLGRWRSKMRCAYNQIQQGQAPNFDLTKETRDSEGLTV